MVSNIAIGSYTVQCSAACLELPSSVAFVRARARAVRSRNESVAVRSRLVAVSAYNNATEKDVLHSA